MLDDTLDMLRNHPLFHYYATTLRHRPYLRFALYGFLFLCSVYLLSSVLVPPQVTIDLPPEVHAPPPIVIPETWEEKAEMVKDAFLHAYHGYEEYAAPHDELKPLNGGSIDSFNGWAVSAFDALDTMILMGLDEEFERALKIIEEVEFKMEENKYAPFFETIIRHLGGLLSAHAMTERPMLLDRADELARKLDSVFNTTSGLPLYGVNPSDRQTRGSIIGVLAEIASLQLEYTYLGKATGNKEHFDRADRVIKALASAELKETGGMFPIHWNLTSAQPLNTHLSVGAQADSTHEYLLKQYLLTGKTDKANLEMYIRATTQVISKLLYLSPKRHLLYVTDSTSSTYDGSAKPSHNFEHLSCFFPGLLALGAHTLPLDNLASLGIDLDELGTRYDYGDAARNYQRLKKYNLKDLHMWAAEGLAQSCWLSYADMPSGLGADEMVMQTEKGSDGYLWLDALDRWRASGSRGLPPGVGDKKPVVYSERERLIGSGRGRDYVLKKTGYLLRPETLESLYLLWKITDDPKWRDRGWLIFESIERYCKTPYGYASIRTVDYVPPPQDNEMPSYVFAETFKYLYLMFIKEDPLPLDKWVFNTEAHPLPVFEWSGREKELFAIP